MVGDLEKIKIKNVKMVEIKKIEELNELLQNKDYVIVDFWAEWCSPCRMISLCSLGIHSWSKWICDRFDARFSERTCTRCHKQERIKSI